MAKHFIISTKLHIFYHKSRFNYVVSWNYYMYFMDICLENFIKINKINKIENNKITLNLEFY